MARILGTGIATLDIINTVECYPPEDAEVRALAQRRARGGNVTNTLTVLSQLGHACAWAGTVASGPDGRFILDDLEQAGVDTASCTRVPTGTVPTSYVTVSRDTGTRTIVHYRDLPELSSADFARIGLKGFDWLHFEGRNVPDTRRMLEHVRLTHPGTPVSVEVEKPRPGIESLFPLADLLLFSRQYAQGLGVKSAADLLRIMQPQAPRGILVCAWGDAGAWALDPAGGSCASPAYPPPRLLETLGAGDVFNAGVIHARLQGRPLDESLDLACRLAGRKCGQIGLAGLAG